MALIFELSSIEVSEVKTVIGIPSYNEIIALPELVRELMPYLRSQDALLILDDSSPGVFQETVTLVESAFVGSAGKLLFSNFNGKSGRGAAVRRGMKLSREKFPHLVHFIECDADGSHRVVDIIKVRDLESHDDLLIGSRYLPESKIVGWPMTRRVFSYLLNISIPCLLKVRVSDVTNGLRRYSITAVDAILAKEPINKGFIYLSEQALILRNQGYVLGEVPIIFVDRTLGKSTVTWREIVASLKGISDLFFSRNKLK